MKQEVKDKWLAALRSREYKQVQQKLVRDTEEGIGYCCLGVLCDIYSKETGTPWKEIDTDHKEILPSYVRLWAGLSDGNPEVDYEDHRKSLANLNDDGMTFEQIADIIEKQL